MEIYNKKLSNNAICLLVKDVNSPGVTITAQFRAGARFESDSQNGLAHLLEHMIFKGSVNTPDPKELAFKIENLGASVNAWTSQELTGYHISGPKFNISKMIDFLSEMLMRPLFQDKELEKEKRVIIEEIKMYEDHPQEKVADEFLAALFPNHPLGRNIAGSISSLHKLKTKDCKSFMGKYYSANNLLMIVAGDFDVDKTFDHLNKTFGLWSSHDIYEGEDFINRDLKEKEIRLERKLEQTHIVLGGYSYSYLDLDIKSLWALNLGRVILAGGFGSLLVQRFREELALTYYIHLSQQHFRETGYYSLSLGVNAGNKKLALQESEKVFKGFMKGAFTFKDVERAKNYLIGNLITYLETSSDIASLYAKQLIQQGKITSQDEIIKLIKGIDSIMILDAWKPILEKNRIVAVLENPK